MYSSYIIRRNAVTDATTLSRTQIYLTRTQQTALGIMARAKGKTQSSIIRDAIDRLLSSQDAAQLGAARMRSAGAWAAPDTESVDLATLRREERFS
jgi:hypothetical protein